MSSEHGAGSEHGVNRHDADPTSSETTIGTKTRGEDNTLTARAIELQRTEALAQHTSGRRRAMSTPASLECGAHVKVVAHIIAHTMSNFRRASFKPIEPN
jgi:hypothetical protein